VGVGRGGPKSKKADRDRDYARPVTSILLVADETWVVTDVAAALADTRYSITVTSDPRSVAGATRDNTPDVVIVDLQVGSMGGMAVTRSVRDAFAVAGGQAPPVVLLLDRDADSFLAGRSGATAWVRKPFGASELRAAVDQSVAAAK
jgi:DNA-binding response OmpR family regulator